MFEIQVEHGFAAGHALRGYRGKCENVHGHNYRVRARLRGENLDAIGLLCDFKDIKAWLREIGDSLDHQFLNDLEPFQHVNPSAENLARHIFERLQERVGPISGLQLDCVTVFETDTTSASYRTTHPPSR